MKPSMEMDVGIDVTFELLEKCREIQKKHAKAFVISDLKGGHMSNGDLLLNGFKLTFGCEEIDSAMEFLTHLKEGMGA